MNTRSSYTLLNACKNDASKSIIALSFLFLSLYDNVSTCDTNVTRAILNQTNDAENPDYLKSNQYSKKKCKR